METHIVFDGKKREISFRNSTLFALSAAGVSADAAFNLKDKVACAKFYNAILRAGVDIKTPADADAFIDRLELLSADLMTRMANAMRRDGLIKDEAKKKKTPRS